MLRTVKKLAQVAVSSLNLKTELVTALLCCIWQYLHENTLYMLFYNLTFCLICEDVYYTTIIHNL